MAQIDLKKLKIEAQKEIEQAKDLKALEGTFRKYLGRRSGRLTRVLRSLKKLPPKRRAKLGKEANELKKLLEKKAERKREKLLSPVATDKERKWLDVTVPGKKVAVGHLHPLSQARVKIEDTFQRMGFAVIGGPEIETEWYNFDALNIPADHPARDIWDTFWLKKKDAKRKDLLLRTHTSPVQVRYMEKHKPPLRVVVPGRIFRHEATDASHEFNFYQVEGLMVGKDICAAHFKAIIEQFFREFFEKSVKIRLRPSFFPFTEPSFEVDMTCLVCGGKGCSVCKKTGWLEMMGAGMVHPNVFKNAGLIAKEWQGFAFGMGLERLTMMKYKIGDIRLFYGGDLRFLKQF